MNPDVSRTAHSKVENVLALQRRVGAHMEIVPNQVHHAEQYYLLLSVSRTHILKDTFDQLWQRRKGELRRPLRVRLNEFEELEIGHDLGGVQIEFFNLVCKEVFSDQSRKSQVHHSTTVSF